MSKIYTKEQIKYLRQIAPGRHRKKIVDMFLRKYPTVQMTEKKMKSLLANYGIVTGVKGNESKYTKKHIKFLREFVPGHTDKETFEEWNRRFDIYISLKNIQNLKKRAGIKNGLIGGRFQKGQVPFNKGKKWSEFMSEEGQRNSLKTAFKMKHRPKNSVPIGTERVTVDGYIEVKIQDGHKNKNWRAKHQIIWEEAKGKIPKGFTLIFLDGNPQNVSLDNLELVSRNELARLNQNHLIFKQKELTEVGMNIAKLKIKISQRKESNA